jgi:hypothetical protein
VCVGARARACVCVCVRARTRTREGRNSHPDVLSVLAPIVVCFSHRRLRRTMTHTSAGGGVAVKMLESAPRDRAESNNSRQLIGGGGGQQHANMSINRGQAVSLTATGQKGARRACQNATSVPHHISVHNLQERTHVQAANGRGCERCCFGRSNRDGACGWLVIVQTSRATSSTLFECTHNNLHDRILNLTLQLPPHSSSALTTTCTTEYSTSRCNFLHTLRVHTQQLARQRILNLTLQARRSNTCGGLAS